MLRTEWIALVGVVVLGSVGRLAAAQQYTLRFNKDSTRMRWSHGLPSWNYAVPVRLSAAGDSTSLLRLSASASVNSILDERSEGKTWQDNASINGSVNYPILGPKASIGIGTNLSVRSATLTKQKIRNQSFTFRFQYSPLQEGRFSSLRVNVTPGLVRASRANRANLDSTFAERGIQYMASLRMSPEFKLAGRKVSHSISLGKTDNTLKSNKNRSDDFSVSLGYTWPGEVRTDFALSESRSQLGVPRSVFGEREENGVVVRDTSVSIELSESRNTRLSSNLGFKVGGFEVRNNASYGENLHTNTASDEEDPSNRYFGKDRQNKRWDLEASVSGKLTSQLVGRTSIRFNAQDERFLPVRLRSGQVFRDPSSDLGSRNLFLNGSLDWQLSDQHALKMAVWTEFSQAANPGAPDQDRDLYHSAVDLSYEGSLESGIKLKMTLTRSFQHRVNLDASRSSDNSRNRDLGLSIDSRYERMGISFSHNFGISAKRTIYDFDRQLNPEETTRKSNIRRGWSMSHSLRRSLFEHLQLNARYAYRADDFGRLLVESQSQIVEEDNSDHNASFGISYIWGSLFSSSANYTWGLDRQWKHQYDGPREKRLLYRRNLSQSLNLSLSYNPSSATRLSLQGSRSRQKSGTFDSFSVSYMRMI